MDETGMPLEHKAPNIIAKKGKKKVRYRSTGNKAQITVVGCVNAVGNAIPPMVIYVAKSFNADWCKCDIPGTGYALSPKGWIDQELFKHWLVSHFVENAVSARPLLLLLDGHSSHYRPDSIEYAREQDIILFCLPPHTTQECQPLDVSVYRPLKMHWTDVCHEFMQQNPGHVVTKFDFSGLLSKAWSRTMTPTNIINGFRKCGVYPFDPAAVKPSTTSPVVVEHSSDEESGDEGEDEISSQNQQESVAFTAEEEALFNLRFEEGFDIFDPRYHDWLRINHPESNHRLYPNLNPEGETSVDLEYMLSLADDLVSHCGQDDATLYNTDIDGSIFGESLPLDCGGTSSSNSVVTISASELVNPTITTTPASISLTSASAPSNDQCDVCFPSAGAHSLNSSPFNAFTTTLIDSLSSPSIVQNCPFNTPSRKTLVTTASAGQRLPNLLPFKVSSSGVHSQTCTTISNSDSMTFTAESTNHSPGLPPAVSTSTSATSCSPSTASTVTTSTTSDSTNSLTSTSTSVTLASKNSPFTASARITSASKHSPLTTASSIPSAGMNSASSPTASSTISSASNSTPPTHESSASVSKKKSPSITSNTSISPCTLSNSDKVSPSSATTSKGLPNFPATSDSSSNMSKFLVKPSDFPVIPRLKSSNKRVKTGARVLTSSDILSLLKEKEDKKKKEAEDKERKKKEKEDRKRLREEEARKKAEDRKRKAEERAKKAADARAARASKARDSSKRGRQTSTASRVKKVRTDSTSTELTSDNVPGPYTANPATPTESQSTPTVPPSDDCFDEIVLDSQGKAQPALTELCGVCYEPYCYPDYCDWIQCACGQWTHEDCVEEIVTDENGEERFCPKCVV